jgi:hypothetical protein
MESRSTVKHQYGWAAAGETETMGLPACSRKSEMQLTIVSRLRNGEVG